MTILISEPTIFPGSFLDDTNQHPCQALNLSKGIVSGVRDGVVKMLVLNQDIPRESNEALYLMAEQEIDSAVRLGPSFPVTPTDFEFFKSAHHLDTCPTNAYGYRVSSVEPFEEKVKVANDESLIVNVEAYLPQNLLKMVSIHKSIEEHIVASAVLVPGVTDYYKEIYDEETVRAAAYYFLENLWIDDEHGMDVMHDGVIIRDALRPVQSFVIDTEITYTSEVDVLEDGHPSKDIQTLTLPKGTWIMYARIVSDILWGKVKDGTYTGFSMAGLARVRELRKILATAA